MLVLPRKSVPSSFEVNSAATGYTSLRNGAGGVARSPKVVALFKAWGFQRGYSVQYEPTGSQTGTGNPVWKGAASIISSAAVFSASHGAGEWLALNRRACTGPGERLVSLPGSTIGDATALCQVKLQYGGNPPPGVAPTYSYEVLWRVGALAASISVWGEKTQVSMGDAVALAKIQNKRIAH
jgi:hypothetical protein